MRCLMLLASVSILSLGEATKEALAHPDHGPTMGERYLRLEVDEDRARLVYGLTYTARFGRNVRAARDQNSDGRIDEGEHSAIAREHARSIGAGVEARVDGQVQTISWAETYVGPVDGPITATPLAIESSGTIALDSEATHLSIHDGAEFEGVYRTSAEIEAVRGVELTAAGRGLEPSGRVVRTTFLDMPSAGQPAVRVLSARFTRPLHPRSSARNENGHPAMGSLGPKMALALLGLICLGIVVRRWRRGRAQRTTKG